MNIQAHKLVKRVILTAGLLTAIPLCPLMGQQPSPQSEKQTDKRQSKPVPVSHLYWHFLIYQHQLDQLASEREQQGKDGESLRTYLQKKLSMTDEDFQPIRESADRMYASISKIRAKAETIMSARQASRIKLAPSPASADAPRSSEGLSPVTAEAGRSGESPSPATTEEDRARLEALNAERETAINDEIERLNSSLTPEAARTLQDYVTNKFSKFVSLVQVPQGQHGAYPSLPPATVNKVQP